MHPIIPQDIQELAEQTTVANPDKWVACVRDGNYRWTVVKASNNESLQAHYGSIPNALMYSHPPMVQP